MRKQVVLMTSDNEKPGEDFIDAISASGGGNAAAINPGRDILLIEDNAADANLMQRELTNSPFGPFRITHVKRLTEALGQLHKKQFDAILLDLGLPDSQGLTSLEQLRKQTLNGIPIMVVTGQNNNLLRHQALAEGAWDYLVKDESVGGIRDRAVHYALEFKRSHDALVAFEHQLSVAADSAQMGIFDWNIRSGRVTWSHHYARLFGLKPEQFQGTYDDFERAVHPEDRAGVRAKIAAVLSRPDDYRHEFRVIWPDGTQHWIEARCNVFNVLHDSRLIGTVMDITGRKLADEAAKRRQAEIARLARANLTPREMALLKLVVAGMPNKRIAVNLKISIKTVAKHRSHLMAKTKALNAADLARMSALAGLT